MNGAENQAQCPRCKRSCPRVARDCRAVCPACSRTLRRVFVFCWACRREWQGPVLQTSCSLPQCQWRAALLSTETIADRTSSVYGCPYFRACPSCEALLTHSGQGCNNVRCNRCRSQLCFRCLKPGFCAGRCDIVDNSSSLAALTV